MVVVDFDWEGQIRIEWVGGGGGWWGYVGWDTMEYSRMDAVGRNGTMGSDRSHQKGLGKERDQGKSDE